MKVQFQDHFQNHGVQCWGAGKFFYRLPLKKAWLPATGSHFYKFLLLFLRIPLKRPGSRLLGAVIRGFYRLFILLPIIFDQHSTKIFFSTNIFHCRYLVQIRYQIYKVASTKLQKMLSQVVLNSEKPQKRILYSFNNRPLFYLLSLLAHLKIDLDAKKLLNKVLADQCNQDELFAPLALQTQFGQKKN